MWRLAALAVALRVASADEAIANFDGSDDSSLTWKTENDWYHGGQSTSSFEEDRQRGVGVWQGEVKTSLLMQSPGWTKLYATPPKKHFVGTLGVVARMRETMSGGLTSFSFVFQGSNEERLYRANVLVGPTMQDHFVKWSDFVCTYCGEEKNDCVGLENELDSITSIGIGTAIPGKAGKFEIEIDSIVARGPTIATFDGAKSTTLDWETVDDPVMGGSSTSKYEAKPEHSVGVWKGTVKKVWYLQKPGFCILQAPKPEYEKLRGTLGVQVRMRETISTGLMGFSFVFRTKAMPSAEWAYRADFAVGPTMQNHFAKWTDFYCTFRGERKDNCAELANDLGNVTYVGLGTVYPGKAGPFNVEIESMVARGDDPNSVVMASALKTTRTMGMEVFV